MSILLIKILKSLSVSVVKAVLASILAIVILEKGVGTSHGDSLNKICPAQHSLRP